MFHLDLGLSAIRSTQVALQTAGNNISNAATVGYHRQRVEFADRLPVAQGGHQLGTGVTVAQIRRLRDEATAAALLRNGSAAADNAARLGVVQQVDSLLTPSTASLAAEATRLFDSLEQLAANPAEPVLRRQVINAAAGLAREMNNTLTELEAVRADLMRKAQLTVDEVESLSTDIARLNGQIRLQLMQGRRPNDLLDQRDALIGQLAELVDVGPEAFGTDGEPFTGAGGTLLFGSQPVDLAVEVTPTGELQLISPLWDRPLTPMGGRLAGLLGAHNEGLVAVKGELLEWFGTLRGELDQMQATGLGPNGPFNTLTSAQSTADPDAPLGRLFDLSAGDLFVTITDLATGARTTQRIAIDPSADSLNDVAALLDGLPNLAATVQPGSHQLTVSAAAGYAFDFAGRIDSVPDASGVTGTAVATIDGLYTGATNTAWDIVAIDAGQVGVTSPLRLEVRDAATGTVLGIVNAGLGYSAGSPLELPDGLTLRLAPGTINAADTWSLSPIATPDETGLVGVLGLRSIFTGSPRGLFGVHPDLVADADELATTRTGLLGDGSNLDRMVALRTEAIFTATDETVEERLSRLIASVGLEVQTTATEGEQLSAIGNRLAEDRDALSGVDVNEEMLSIMRSQQMFQAATRFISTVQTVLDELLGIVR